MVLPSFFMLQSGGKYLSLTENIPANLPSGFLKFDQEQIWSPRVKFAAEPAKTGDGRLFHIRSLYNNKYLVMESNSWIVASAKKPEEDKSKATCTLFEPHSLADDQSVRLRHVGTGISMTHSLSPDDDTHQGVLLSAIGSSFILRDNNSVLVLPSHVAFRSEDLNGDYLSVIYPYRLQQFQSGLDIGDLRVAKELVTTADGNYRIKDSYDVYFWRRNSDNRIMAEVDDGSIETLFSFVQIKDNVVALSNLGNNLFCGATTDRNLLYANYPTLSKETRLIVDEVVLQREISELEYRLSDARIYDEQIIELDQEYGTNNLTTDNTMTLNFHAKDSSTTSWNNSVSISFGVKVTLEVTIVPLIANSKVELSTEFGYTHEWGGSVTKELERDTSYTVTVPPKTTVLVTMLATRGVCDVPFSYVKRDLLPTGEWVKTILDDGIFNGINSYGIHYKAEVVPYEG